MEVINVQDKKDWTVKLHPVKKIEVIIYGEHEKTVASILKEANVQGYTLIRNISGQGHHSFHEGNIFFNDKASLVMFIAVTPESAIATIALGLKTFLQKNSGVMFVSDTSVARVDYFS